MSLDKIKVNTGTGPGIAVDVIGTQSYQVVKIAQGAEGDASVGTSLLVSQTGTANVAVVSAVPISGTVPVSIATLPALSGTSSVSVVGNVPTYPVKPSTYIQGSAVSTTSGAAFIIITSGANTLYITDLLVSVNTAMSVSLRSATTQISIVYLSTNGGYLHPMVSPMVLGSNQSLTVLQSASGSCSVYAAGYTVT